MIDSQINPRSKPDRCQIDTISIPDRPQIDTRSGWFHRHGSAGSPLVRHGSLRVRRGSSRVDARSLDLGSILENCIPFRHRSSQNLHGSSRVSYEIVRPWKSMRFSIESRPSPGSITGGFQINPRTSPHRSQIDPRSTPDWLHIIVAP